MTLLIAKRVVLKTRAYDFKRGQWSDVVKTYCRSIPSHEMPEETTQRIVCIIKKLNDIRDVNDIIFSFEFFHEGEWYRVPKGRRTMPFSIFTNFELGRDDRVNDMGYYDSVFGPTYLIKECNGDEDKFYSDIPYLVDFVFRAAGARALYMINHTFRNPLNRLKYTGSTLWKPGI